MTGSTFSPDFPGTSGAYQGNNDVFVTKLNPSGTGLIYSTFIGGTSSDVGRGIAIDNAGNAYVTGNTSSTNFPFTVNPFSSGQHAFALKLGTTGNILYATGLAGSSSDDSGTAIAVDASGSAYVAGSTTSTNFPVTPGSYKTTPGGGTDGFVAKLSSSGQISYATYLGGSSTDFATAIAVDAAGNAFVGGNTSSSNFSTSTGAYATAYAGSQDAFVVKLNPSGSALVYATYLGGSGAESLNGLAIDAAGNCYVVGSTQSGDFPITPGAFLTGKPSSSGTSGFVTKLNATGTSLVYSTFLGGDGSDGVVGIAVDSSGSVYVAGNSQSTNFPTTPGALKTGPSPFTVDADMFLAWIGVDGSVLSYSTLLGSSNPESANGLSLDGIGGVYIIGVSQSLLYPTTAGAYQTSNPKSSTRSSLQSIVIGKVDFNSATLCNPSVAPQSQSLPGRGGAISFNLTLSPGCPWEAVPGGGSLTLNAPKYGIISTSPVLITGTVPENPDTTSGVILTQTVRIGAATFTINQDASSCQDLVISPLAVAFDSNGGLRNLSLTLPSACKWFAVPAAPWLSVSNNPSGSGNASITIFAGPNSFSPRSTTLTLTGKTIPVTQSGSTCTATANVTVSGTSSQGGDGVVSITTNSATCRWNAYAVSPWIQINASAASGQRSGIAPFVVAPNPGAFPRTGQILIADITLSVSQDAGPSGTVSSYSLSTYAGGGSSSTPNRGDGGPALGAYFGSPLGLAFDPNTSSLYIVDYNGRIRVVTPDGNINTFAGGGNDLGENVPATSAVLVSLSDVAVDSSSVVYFNDSFQRVRKISQGKIVTFAGNLGSSGFSGDNGPATQARLFGPQGIAADSAGNVYISDTINTRVRKVTGGIITTFAGGGNNGLGDNGPATSARFTSVSGLALDTQMNLLIADSGDNRVRKVAQGNIATVAGGANGALGDGGPATSATLSGPHGIAVDPLGDLFIAEGGRVRRVSVDGTINTMFIGGAQNGLAADRLGNVYFSDQDTNTVKKLTPLPSFCSYSVSTPPQIPLAGGSMQVSITTTAGCRWGAFLFPAWLTPSGATTGIGNGAINLTASPNPGTIRTATLAVGGMAVQVTQSGVPAVLSLNRQTLNFTTSASGAATSPQTVTVSFPGGGGVAWTATSNQANIVVLQGSGTGNGSFQVSANLGPSGIVTVTAPGATGSPKQIQVNVSNAPAGPPFGSFDTPADNTTGVAGALAVTGWALDGVEVVKVDIWREPVGTEPTAALIFIGDAVFVEGARPDVEALNPKVPFNYRAGWGYQLLSNFLPTGNGTFKLHAIAHNKAGASADLGTKTIVVDNAHSSQPFGAIDTPSQGGTASGTAYVNFGWALTQNPNKIPIDGSTISVVVDGQVVGHPTYNQFRSDIASLFPGYMNSGGAVGYFYLDTTKLINGVHTISWNVFDNAGQGAGIGSRYFNVFNIGGSTAEPDEPIEAAGDHLDAVEIEELGQIEVPLGAISGYQLVNGERRALPIGSSLRRGVFYWQPGPGFMGEHNLVFKQKDGTEVGVSVKIHAKKYRQLDRP